MSKETCHGQWWKQASDNPATRSEDDGAIGNRATQERQEVAGDPRPLDAEPDRRKMCRGRLALFLEPSEATELS